MLKKISNLAGVTFLSAKEQKNLKGGGGFCPGGPTNCCSGSGAYCQNDAYCNYGEYCMIAVCGCRLS